MDGKAAAAEEYSPGFSSCPSLALLVTPAAAGILYQSLPEGGSPGLTQRTGTLFAEHDDCGSRTGLDEETKSQASASPPKLRLISVVPRRFPANCAICGGKIESPVDAYDHCEDCVGHKVCFIRRLEAQTEGKMLLTTAECEKYKRACPKCLKDLTNRTIKMTLLEGKRKDECVKQRRRRKETEHSQTIYHELMEYANKEKVIDLPCCDQRIKVSQILDHVYCIPTRKPGSCILLTNHGIE